MTILWCPNGPHPVKRAFEPEGDEWVCDDHPGTRLSGRNLSKPRKPLSRVSPKREAKVGRRPTLKRGRGFAASKAQQDKVRGLPCAVCGRDGYEVQIHAAHVWPRAYTPCECAEGVVPLCAADHRQYDDPNQHLDLLPALVNRGYRAELVHAVVAHDVPLRELLQQVTGVCWEPVQEREAVATRA